MSKLIQVELYLICKIIKVYANHLTCLNLDTKQYINIWYFEIDAEILKLNDQNILFRVKAKQQLTSKQLSSILYISHRIFKPKLSPLSTTDIWNDIPDHVQWIRNLRE